jgi:hypothetical protein
VTLGPVPFTVTFALNHLLFSVTTLSLSVSAWRVTGLLPAVTEQLDQLPWSVDSSKVRRHDVAPVPRIARRHMFTSALAYLTFRRSSRRYLQAGGWSSPPSVGVLPDAE